MIFPYINVTYSLRKFSTCLHMLITWIWKFCLQEYIENNSQSCCYLFITALYAQHRCIINNKIQHNNSSWSTLSSTTAAKKMVPHCLPVYFHYFSYILIFSVTIILIIHRDTENQEMLTSLSHRSISRSGFLISVPMNEKIVPIANVDSQQDVSASLLLQFMSTNLLE